jgi:hypothetical protein
MASKKLPAQFVALLKSVTAKRARTVITHILKHGQITTEELKDTYGYSHPPRAVRDVKERGIPIETLKVRGKDGRPIAVYRFGDPSTVRRAFAGRHAFPKAFKTKLLQNSGSRCHVCFQQYEERYLQVDHRIPYEVAGDVEV